jgi:hypothetical protein
MTPNRSINFTPFFMVYGVEAVLPTELRYGSPRVWPYQPGMAKEARKNTVDLLGESRDITVMRSARYQQELH